MFGWFKKHEEVKITTNEKVENDKSIKLSKKQIKEKEEYIKILMNKTNPPIVILDNGWYKVKSLVGNEKINVKENKLKELLKEQATLIKTIKQDNLIKHNFMQQVLSVSDRVNSAGDMTGEVELEKLHQGILKIGEQIKKQEERLVQVEEEMKEINLELIEEAVAIGYEHMERCKVQSASLGEEIDALREQVLQKSNEKKVYDEHTNILYQYLHNMIGYKHIDKVDKVLGEGKKND